MNEAMRDDTPAGRMVEDTVNLIVAETGCACAVVVVERDGDKGSPVVSWAGNVTDAALCVHAMLEAAVVEGPPEGGCDLCVANFRRMVLALQAMSRHPTPPRLADNRHLH
jgi:hypothetical protein